MRFSKTTFWNRLNTGFLDPAVATVLTACGIETISIPIDAEVPKWILLQQYLPLAVLKLSFQNIIITNKYILVATVLTACGIETFRYLDIVVFFVVQVATVLTACGIETLY